MSVASVLARGRLAAENLMIDTCRIRVSTGQTTDDLTGDVTPTYAPLYGDPGGARCKFQTAGAGAMGRRYDVGEVALVVLRLELHLPIVGSELVVRGALVEAITCVHDASMVGRVFRVHDLSHKSFATARRFLLEEVT